MTIGIGPLGYPQPVSTPRFVASTDPAPVAAPIPPVKVDRVEINLSPPVEAQVQVDAAYERAIELASEQRELHFFRDEESGRIVVQVTDLEGKLIRTIPNAEMFDVLEGAPL